MARLFYPILFCVTAALAAALWAREGWPVDWLRAFDAPLAQGQVVDAPRSPAPPANRYPTRYPSTQFPATRYSAARYPTTSADPRAGGAAVANKPAAGQRAALNQSSAPPANARLRISAPGAAPTRGDPAANGAPIELETTKLIARIGNEHILLGDVITDVYKEFAQKSRRVPPAQHQELLSVLVSQHVHQLIPLKVLLSEVRRKVPKEELEKTWKQVEYIFDHRVMSILLKDRKLDTAAALDAQLKSEGSSLEKHKQMFVEQQLAQQFLTDHTKVDEEVHPDDLFDYYQAHYEEYKFSAKVRWEQLLVKFDGRTKQEARQLIADMGNQVRAGVPWEAVAKARSQGPAAAEGGKRDWTSQGSLKFAALDQALFTLPVGAMSPILEDEDDVQIVRVVERTPAGAISFEEKQREIKKLIVDERAKKAKNEFVKKIVEEYKPQIWTVFQEGQAAKEKKRETARRPGAPAAR